MSRTKLFIFLMAVLAMAVLFAAPAVMAMWPEPPPIYDNLPMSTTISVFKGGTYTVVAEVVPDVTVDGITGDQYKLTFSGPINNITRVYLTTPRWEDPNNLPTESKYCSEPLSVLYTSDDWQQNQNKEVLWETKGIHTMQWTSMSPDGIWFLIADKIEVEDLVPGTICIGENRYFGCGELAVLNCPRPDCLPPPAVGVASSGRQCMNLYGKQDVQGDETYLSYVRKPDAEACVDPTKKSWICPGLCPEVLPATDADYEAANCTEFVWEKLPDNHIVRSSFNGDRCPDEGIQERTGSPFYYIDGVSGGYGGSYCYDIGWQSQGTSPWVSLDCCFGASCP